MNIEELAFKDRKSLTRLNENDLLDIIEFLQLDRKQWINQFSETHNESVEIQKENLELKEINNRLYNENCKLREEHNITDINLLDENYGLQQKYLNAVVGYKTTMAEKEQLNSLVNSCQEEIRKLKEQLEKVLNDYCRLDAYNRTQQKEFIKFLEDEIKKATTNPYTKLSEYGMNRIHIYKEILQKYKAIVGDNKKDYFDKLIKGSD